MEDSIRLFWEKPTARSVCYYEVDPNRDLGSSGGSREPGAGWVLGWAKFGSGRVSSEQSLVQIAAIQKRRRQRCYVVVAGADPRDETR